jgi:plasmid stabilization system protein ParE
MYTVIFSKSADKDIISIVKHVAAENPADAQKTRQIAVQKAIEKPCL